MIKRLAIVISVALLMGVSYRFGQQSPTISAVIPLDFGVARQVWEVVNQNYLRADDIDLESIKYGLAKGLVGALDDNHSDYMDPDEAKDFMASLNGDLQGIGAELRLVDGIVTVVNPLPDSPAERAGIRPGDMIMKVDGETLGPIADIIEVVTKIRGPAGTIVKLTIIHEDNPKPIDIEIRREEIHLNAIEWSEKEFSGEKIAYIRLASFTEDIGKEFADAIEEIVRIGYKKLILDLRFNGGGYLEGSVDVLSHFIEADKPVVFIRDQEQEIARNAFRVPVNFQGEIVVLVNDSSASASEIVAGALRDYDLAHLIGVKTYGKGSVQEVHPFSDQSLLRLTIAEWLTPLKKNIEMVGIEPDQVLELDFDAFKEGEDNQLDAALEYLVDL